MTVYSIDQIKALAPDAASLSAALGLAHASDWSLLAKDAAGNALWGEIKGSGKSPYQARIDLAEPAFKCSCPSRKFPCKHGLALLMVHAKEAQAFTAADRPTWVSDWLDARQNKASARGTASDQALALADLSDLEREAILLKQAKKAQKSAAEKAEKAATGTAQCSLFLQDILRTGLSQLPQHADRFEPLAAQLVDAQLPGLARMLRQAASVPYSGLGWEERLLANFAQIELILTAQRKRETALKTGQSCLLPEALLADLDQALGYTTAQELVLAAQGIKDHWQVLGHVVTQDAAISTRVSWLHGQSTQHFAMLLTFAAGNQSLPAAWPVGARYEAELVFYPSAAPLRALIKGAAVRIEATTGLHTAAGAASGRISHALNRYAQALSQLPWLNRWPMLLQDVCLQWKLNDADGHLSDCHVVDSQSEQSAVRLSLPLAPKFQHLWRILALTGNAPTTLAGEWDGVRFTPLSLHHEGRCHVLSETPLTDGRTG